MKNRRHSFPPALRTLSSLAILALTGAGAQAADLTWIGPADPDTGVWDVGTTANWNDGASDTTWTDGDNAIFTAGSYNIDIADGGVFIKDLTFGGGGELLLKSVTDNEGIIVVDSGGGTWDTGGGTISLYNLNDTFDTPLEAESGDTLTIVGGGSFDTGENPTDANWMVEGAILDIASATTVRGNSGSVGQFATVKMADGSTYLHRRNMDQTYANDWELGAGTITFDNSYARSITLSGVISGPGTLKAESMANKILTLSNTGNTFSGGLTVGANTTVLITDVAQMGDAAGDLTLNDGGIVKLQGGIDLGGTREIVLTGTGGAIVNAGVNFFSGNITGSGDFQVGDDIHYGNTNVITLSGTADYTGATNIRVGSVKLGADEALNSGVMTIGGANTARLVLDGHTQTIGGLLNVESKTKQIVNLNATTTDSTPGTLIFDVAEGADYSAGSATGVVATDDRGNFSIIKNGLGSQTLGNVTISGDATVNEGTLTIGNSNGTCTVLGQATVTGGTLAIAEEMIGLTSIDVTGGGTLRISADNYLGDLAAPITLDGGTLNVQLENSTGGSFEIDSSRPIILGADGGTIQTTTPSGAWYVAYNGEISGTGSLVKSSGQTLELGGDNTYTGATTISGGTLRLTGSLASDVTVQDGTTFLAGDSATGTGTGTMASLTLEAGAKMVSFLDTDLEDACMAIVSGAVTIDPAATLAVGDRGTGEIIAIGTKFTLIDYTGGSLTGTFDGLADGSTITVGSNLFVIDYNDDETPDTVTLTSAGSANPYTLWVDEFTNLTDSSFPLDFDNGGLSTGVEYVVGGDPTLGSDDASLAPSAVNTGTTLEFTFRRTDLANEDANTTITVEYGSDLLGWTTAADGVDGIVITETDNFYEEGVDQVIVSLPAALATDGKIFARLNVEQP